jgi:hypothetical protein
MIKIGKTSICGTKIGFLGRNDNFIRGEIDNK